MGVEIAGKYLGGKKTQLTHGPSGAEVLTDAPKDIQGDGSRFSPTDLVGAALGSCILTTVALVAERDGLDIKGSHFLTVKEMGGMPRRIQSLNVTIHFPKSLSEQDRRKLETVAHSCPVHHALKASVSIPMEFVYDL